MASATPKQPKKPQGLEYWPGLKLPAKNPTKRVKRPRKPTVAKLKKKADQVFSVWIRTRDMGVCITCNGVGNQAGHFQSRRYSSTRYNELNVNGQCARCNIFRSGEQYKYSLALDEKHGPGTAEKLAQLAQTHHKFTIEELQNIIKKYASPDHN